MMEWSFRVFFLGCFIFGAAKSLTTCDPLAEAGTEAVLLLPFDTDLDDMERDEEQEGKDGAEEKRIVTGYALSPNKSTSCSDLGYENITTAQECKDAALAGDAAGENWDWDGTRDWGNRLPGCLYDGPPNHCLNFNTNLAGQGVHNDQRPVCRIPPGVDQPSTSAPPTALPSGYALSPNKSTSCSDLGYENITTAQECKDAALAGVAAGENWNWDGTRDWGNRLSGCLYDGHPHHDINFNTNPAGQGIHNDQRPLCRIPPENDQTSAPPTALPSAIGDPHVVTSRGFKLDLNQPGEYILLQVPYDGPPLLRFEATVERSGMSCMFYVTKARFLGAWFHEATLKIRAEDQDGRPFAIQMADAEPWASLIDISSDNETDRPISPFNRSSSWMADADPFNRSSPTLHRQTDSTILKTYKHANVEVKVMANQQTTKGVGSHKGPEGSFSVLVAKPGQPHGEETIIKIAKGEHWLNIAVTRLGNLGYSKMGGVLGTDVPNAKWTELPDDCKMFHELQGEDTRRGDTKLDFEPNADASISWY